MGTRLSTLVILPALAGAIALGVLAVAPASEPIPGAPGARAAAKVDRPKAAPHYTGTIEKVKVHPGPAGRPAVRVLVRTTGPGKQPNLIWIHLDDATLEQDGAELEAGSAVSVWATGGVAKSDPPQAWGTYVVCQPAKK